MNKKSFTKNNPAIQFISDVKESPAEGQGVAAPQAQEPTPALFQYKKDDKETKTRRIQIVLRPSLAEKLKERARREGTSVNDFISQLLERTL